MKLTREQIFKIRYFLKLFYDKYPRKRLTSLVTVGTLNLSCLSFSIYNLFLDDYDIFVVFKSLIASGVSSALLISMVILFMDDDILDEKKEISKKRIRK